MSLDYFIFYKEKYGLLISHIEEIIYLYDDLIDGSYDLYNSFFDEKEKPINLLCEIETLLNEKENYLQRRNKLNQKSIYYKDQIQKLCTHDFCEDVIDVTPEKSQKIVYCIKCEYSKN
jgi:hypothetical protein